MTTSDPRARLEAALAALLRQSGQLRATVDELHAEVDAMDLTPEAQERAVRIRANDEGKDNRH